ncbi:Nitric oxide reductase subunit C [bioreactor metagenome]|uniref:Nitric oxide reductase subunit C n=1 Tax=bioreactor metagenome TaxID=1076179 RepID=A0A644SUH3_9ZZZZ|nr:cytochrome c [Negativicutes bacterium]
MRQKLQVYCVIIILASSGFGFLIYKSISNVNTQSIPIEAIQGKQIFQRKACIECHTVFGNGGYWGGDLTKVYDKYGYQRITDYLSAGPLLSGAKHKRHQQLTTEEAEQVSAYLQFINSIKTFNWPPQGK